jgi:1,4-dihydroxy-2-naphthoate octaprenyltransferase
MEKENLMKTARIYQLLKIIRPHIVAGGVLAFLLGVLLAVVNGGTFDFSRVAFFYAIVFFGDLSTHYSNDYFDYQTDQHLEKKKFFSGSKILVRNPTLRPLARKLALSFLVLSLALAALAVISRVAPIELLLITLAANFLGWFYSAQPLRLVSRGLGEVAIAVAVGFAIPAVGYLSVKGGFDGWFGFFVLPFVLYGFMLAFSLEAPDIEVDGKSDKKSIGVLKGERFVLGAIFAAALGASLLFAILALTTVWRFEFLVVTTFSTVPLVSGLAGFILSNHRALVNRFSTANVFSLFFFNLLMVSYLAVYQLFTV